MKNLKRNLNSFIKWKGARRIAAAIMAVIVVLVSVDLSGFTIVAEDETQSGAQYVPYYDANTHKYIYNENDILYAATHVHLFGRTVTTSAHTHGNVFTETGNLGEIGTRRTLNPYFDTNPAYHEVNYIQDSIEALESSSSLDVLVVGDKIGVNDNTVQLSSGSYSNALNANHIYKDTATVTAIDFDAEFAKLRARSAELAKTPETNYVSLRYDITSDQNNRYINVGGLNAYGNVYLDISYADWKAYSNKITISGLDADPNNTGILVINIDMKGAKPGEWETDGIEMGLNDMDVYTNNGSFENREYGTDEYGICRILVNLYDSSQNDYIYRGTVKFSNVFFGSILAPGAKVTVGAINGTVVAEEINHTGAESHRMDLVGIGSSGSSLTSGSYLNIELNKTYADSNNSGLNADNYRSVLSATEFRLYTSKDCSEGSHIATANPYWNPADGSGKPATVTFRILTHSNSNAIGERTNDFKALDTDQDGTINLYIKEYSTSFDYDVSSNIYRVEIKYNTEDYSLISTEYYIIDSTGNEQKVSEDNFVCNNEKRSTSQTGETISLYVNKVYAPHLPNNETQAQLVMQATEFTLFRTYDAAKAGQTNDPSTYVGTPQSPNRSNEPGAAVTATFEISGENLPTNGGSVVYYLRETKVPTEFGYIDNKDVDGVSYIYAVKITDLTNGAYSVSYARCPDDYVANGALSYTDGYPTITNYTEVTSQNPSESEDTNTTISVPVSLTKVFQGTSGTTLSVGDSVYNATTFALYGNFDSQTGAVSTKISDNVTWARSNNTYTATISGISTEDKTYTYYLAEDECDNSYVKSQAVWEVTISVSNGSASVSYKELRSDTGSALSGSGSATPASFVNTYDDTTSGETPTPTPASATLTIQKTFSDSFGDLDSDTVSSIIGSTTFGLFTDQSCSDASKVSNVTFTPTTTGKAQTITYIATVSNITEETTYYIKETGTNGTYYNLDSSTIWKVVISADGKTVTYTLVAGGTLTSNTEAANFTNTRVVTVTPDPTPKAVTVSVSLEKTFNNFGNLTSAEQTSVKGATNFRLYAEDYKTWLDVTFTAGATVGNKVTYSTGEFTVEIPANADHVTYYLKEIATDTNYYELNDLTTWRVEIYEDGHVVYTLIVGQNSGNGNVAEFFNESEPLTRTATVSFVKLFNDNFDGLSQSTIEEIIRRTNFRLYTNQNYTTEVIGFNRSGNVSWDATNHRIVYSYTVPVTLAPGESVTYYLKETGTDTRYYGISNTVYSVTITLPINETTPTVVYKDASGGTITTPSFTNLRNEESVDTTPEVEEVTVELIKSFNDFDQFGADQNTIIGNTTFALYSDRACTNSIASFKRTDVVRDADKITYYFSLSVSDLTAGQSVTYYLKEARTDSRYNLSDAIWEVKITVNEDKTDATVQYRVLGTGSFTDAFPTFVNTVKASDPSGSTGGTTPSTPNNPGTPSTGGNNNNSGGGSNNNNSGTTNNGGGSSNNGNNSTNTPGGNLILTGTSGTSSNASATGSNSATSATGGANDVTSSASGSGSNTLTESATDTMSSSTAPQTGESNAPFAVFGGSMAMIFIVGTVYVWRKKETIEEA